MYSRVTEDSIQLKCKIGRVPLYDLGNDSGHGGQENNADSYEQNPVRMQDVMCPVSHTLLTYLFILNLPEIFWHYINVTLLVLMAFHYLYSHKELHVKKYKYTVG